MAGRNYLFPDELDSYVGNVWRHEAAIFEELRQETSALPQAGMQIGPDHGQWMQFLVRLTGARKCLEVGTFTGYSSLATALALPPEGRMICCDVSEEFTAIARKYWAKAGVAEKIELRLGPAVKTLATLKQEGHIFDFAFIDADKPNYPAYFDAACSLVRPGGLILIDNVLWSGQVADPSFQDEDNVKIREVNRLTGSDPRVETVLLPIGDGISVSRVK